MLSELQRLQALPQGEALCWHGLAALFCYTGSHASFCILCSPFPVEIDIFCRTVATQPTPLCGFAFLVRLNGASSFISLHYLATFADGCTQP